MSVWFWPSEAFEAWSILEHPGDYSLGRCMWAGAVLDELGLPYKRPRGGAGVEIIEAQ
jgi:hypothetical protein